MIRTHVFLRSSSIQRTLLTEITPIQQSKAISHQSLKKLKILCKSKEGQKINTRSKHWFHVDFSRIDLHRSPGSDPLEKGARWIKRVGVKKAEQRSKEPGNWWWKRFVAGWFSTIERRRRRRSTTFRLFAWKKRPRLQNVRVCARRRRRKFDRFHGEKVYCSRVVNRS